MTTIGAHGIGASLPEGFEGRIFVRPASPGATTYPVAQFATFPIPDDVGDFGSGAVNLMRPGDVFATLFEYGPESVGTRLFAHQGRPRSLTPGHFSTSLLRRALVGQAGTQWFFTEAGRPFSFYAVLGSHGLGRVLVPRVNALLRQLTISPAPVPRGGVVELIGLYLVAAGLLLGAGVAKAVRPGDTARALGALPGLDRVPTRLLQGATRVGAAAEAVLGFAALAAPGPLTGGLVSASYILFAAVTAIVRVRGGALSSCGCFGRADTPASWLHVVLNLVFAVAAATVATSTPATTTL